MRKNKKYKIEREVVLKYLKQSIDNSKHLYKTNSISVINLSKNENFISDILNDCINDIFNKLDNSLFTLKYQIYNESVYHPSFLFYQKKALGKFMIFDKIDMYKYDKFGIRFEFIDPDSNRYIYIIIIE